MAPKHFTKKILGTCSPQKTPALLACLHCWLESFSNMYVISTIHIMTSSWNMFREFRTAIRNIFQKILNLYRSHNTL